MGFLAANCELVFTPEPRQCDEEKEHFLNIRRLRQWLRYDVEIENIGSEALFTIRHETQIFEREEMSRDARRYVERFRKPFNIL